LINACIEIGCGGLGAFVALGDGVVLGSAGVADDDCPGADTTLEVGDETSGAGAVVGSPALQATRTRAAGSTQSPFTQPVFPVGQFCLARACWSHGEPVISMGAAGESSVIRLIYIGEIPRREIEDPSWIYNDPNIRVGGDGTVRLVEDWLRSDEGIPMFTGEVADYLNRVGRRPATLATLTDPQTAAAWETIPTTVLIGRDDSVSEGDVRWARNTFSDVRFIDSDHFIIFRHPRSVADLVLESFV
jgi:hypothetical protein